MERYARYREQIRRMPESDFPRQGVSASNEPEETEVGAPSLKERGEGQTSPYSLYLHQRRVWFIVKVALLVVAVALFILWWFLMQGRKPV